MSTDKIFEAEIDSLLGQSDQASLIDALMAIPDPARNDRRPDAWSDLVHARMQTRLSQRMRRVINSDGQLSESTSL